MRLLLTGASGQLGGYLLRELAGHDATVTAWSGSRMGELFGFPLRPVDLADPDRVAPAFREARPTVVIHSAAVTVVADCFREPQRAWEVNARGSAVLAELAAAAGARLVLVSTDMVFDGHRGGYREEDPPSPVSVYGRTKREAEDAVLAFAGNAVVRVSLLFGPTLVNRPSFFDNQVKALCEGRPCRLFVDEWRTPLGLPTAARALVAIARSDCTGVLHLGGPERLSRWDMGRRVAAFLGADPSLVVPGTRADLGAPEPRPPDLSLDSSRWRELFPGQPWPAWEEALKDFLDSHPSLRLGW